MMLQQVCVRFFLLVAARYPAERMTPTLKAHGGDLKIQTAPTLPQMRLRNKRGPNRPTSQLRVSCAINDWAWKACKQLKDSMEE